MKFELSRTACVAGLLVLMSFLTALMAQLIGVPSPIFAWFVAASICLGAAGILRIILNVFDD